jgi:AAA+ ATPase superfamily predicted ATPase
MENPFIITGKIKPEYFCDREVEAERIIRKVTSGENIVLMAARRVGKSKLIDFCLDSPMVKNDFIAPKAIIKNVCFRYILFIPYLFIFILLFPNKDS